MGNSTSRFAILVFGAVSFLVMAASWIQPINSIFYRGTFLIGLAGTLLAIVWMPRNNLVRLLILLLIGGLGYTAYYGEPSSVNRLEFEKLWVDSAISYEGSPYRFGGESFMGLDSVGLLRRSLVITQLRLAVATKNPYFLKAAYDVWKEPFSLSTLLHPENEWMEFIGYYAPDRNVSFRPGDVLIGRNRSDMVVYLGNQNVLGISPRTNRVGVHPLGDQDLLVFSSWSYVVRWQPSKITAALRHY